MDQVQVTMTREDALMTAETLRKVARLKRNFATMGVEQDTPNAGTLARAARTHADKCERVAHGLEAAAMSETGRVGAMAPTVHIGIRAPQALADALRDVAAIRGTTLSIEVRRALWAHAERVGDQGDATDKPVTEPTHA